MQNNLSTSNFSLYVKRTIIILMILGLTLIIFNKYIDLVKYPRDSLCDFYKFIERDTVDILCIGSSHVYCSINPVQMYDDYGIAAYDLSAGGQAIWCSYYYILEALKRQKPQIVLLDVFTMSIENDSYFDHDRVQSNLLNMKPSYNKWEALRTAQIDRGG